MSKYKFETLQLHVGQEQADPATDARAVPIYQTTSYVFHNCKNAADRFGLAAPGNIYSRLTNSTQDVLEKRIAALEGGSAALALASGAAAVTYTIEALAANGGHIVAQKTIYGGTYNLLRTHFPSSGSKRALSTSMTLQRLRRLLRGTRGQSSWRRSATPTATFRILMPLRKSPISTGFRSLSTTPLAHRI